MENKRRHSRASLQDKTSGTKGRVFTIAVAGNPNAGKTTIFNLLTGSRQKVGNYGGVTVETTHGSFQHGGCTFRVVDLPGTYSLTAYSMEEIVARDFILNEKPDVVLDVVDATNLERNLYLSAQLRELQVPMVIALNMADEMKQKGIQVDTHLLEQNFGAPVVPTIGIRGKGLHRLVHRLQQVATGQWERPELPPIHYGPEIDMELEKIAQPIRQRRQQIQDTAPSDGHPLCLAASPRWVALKLLENDHDVLDKLHDSPTRVAALEQVNQSRGRLLALLGEDPETIIAEQRYGYVHGITRAAVRQPVSLRQSLTDKIDKVLTNRLLGLPIFIFLVYVVFWMVFTLGQKPMDWIEYAQVHISNLIVGYWPGDNLLWLQSLLVDGVIAGVGGVLVFVPNIVLLFLAISLLEDTGYMARAAFIMDRLMRWVGLHGKSFIPMLTGFGCTVPAIMATRILDNRRDRLTTILILPLMSCGARLPIYIMISEAFFPHRKAQAMFAIYLIGIVLSVLCAKLLRKTLFKGQSSPFVMELPPYRIPTLNAVLIHLWQRTQMYLRKAGTIILAFSVLMWTLASFPKPPQESLAGLSDEQIQRQTLSYSITGRIAGALEPILKPIGFDGRIGTALIGAIPAKELFVSQMSIVFSFAQDSPNQEQADPVVQATHPLRETLQRTYTPLVGFCIMLFCLIASPCMATVAITKKETGSWKWAALQFGGLTVLAYILTFIVYQAGLFLKLGI